MSNHLLKMPKIKKKDSSKIFQTYKYFVNYIKIDSLTNSFNGSIAIVDDEPDIVLVFINVLQDNNYKVKGFTILF